VTSYFGQRSRVSERRPKQQIIRAWLFLSSGVAHLAISVREVQGQDPNSSFFSDNLSAGRFINLFKIVLEKYGPNFQAPLRNLAATQRAVYCK
jgi:hypothetical protein